MLTDADVAALGAAPGSSFSFHPAIRGFAENVWQFDRSSRIEFCATNTATGNQIWFPRNMVLRVTTEAGGVILELNREYEYKGGLWPVKGSPLQKSS